MASDRKAREAGDVATLMPTVLLAMEDKTLFPTDLSRDSFDADSLSGLHASWLDDEQLNNLPIMDVFADLETPRTEKTATEDQDAQLLDAALELPFDAELSPILEPFADAPHFEALETQAGAMSPLRIQRKSPRRTPRRAATTPRQVKSGMVQLEDAGANKRPRTRSSSWQEQEQNTFFSMFKVKWPESAQAQPFSVQLLERFDAISTKVRTKSVMEVRQFYTTVIKNIADMLQLVVNDIDLTNPDQVRIAVWCWKKLITNKKHSAEFEALDSEPAVAKVRLANALLQSIIRSRRQMLKAKSDHAKDVTSHPKSSNAAEAKSPGLTSISAWVSRSNLSSFFAKGNVTIPEDPSVQIHHPMVRKKHPIVQHQVAVAPAAGSVSMTEDATKVLSLPAQYRGESPNGSALKRKRSDVSGTPIADLPAEKRQRSDEVEAASFMSPTPTNKRSRSRTRNGVAFHTPQQLSKKKIYIKMRMVPRDKQTKADVVSSGCRHKVELKLSSTKKISEVAAHMSKKWSKVRPRLPKGAVLRFFQKNSSVDAFHGADGWSKEDSNVTCFDIWKHCGKQTNGENVVEVSYLWRAPAATDNAAKQNLKPLGAPAGLFEEEVSAQCSGTSSGEESEAPQLSPAHGLQAFGEKVAFDRSLSLAAKEHTATLEALMDECPDEDLELSPTTGRPRRRIQPTLVSTEEFNI